MTDAFTTKLQLPLLTHAWTCGGHTKVVNRAPANGLVKPRLPALNTARRSAVSSLLAVGLCSRSALRLCHRQRRRHCSRLNDSQRNISLHAAAEEGVEVSDALGAPLRGEAILVGYDPGPSKDRDQAADEPQWTPEESLEELEVLCAGLEIKVKDRVLQRWRRDRGRWPIGKGKINDLRKQVEKDSDIGMVIFDKDLSVQMMISLKARIAPRGDCVILDRTSLILRVFAARARTREAKLQITLASHQFMLPRLRYYLTEGGGLEARGGGVAGSTGKGPLRGAGETQYARDKTQLVKKISEVNKEINDVRKQREMVRRNQKKLGLPVIALVGYTNAGKSTLMNKLFGSNEVDSVDRLFETLDPTRRRVRLENGREAMLVDTVGFVQRLPQFLVVGFRATLEEILDATLLLHVVDASSPTAAQQINTVIKTLEEIPGFDVNTPQLLVFNKVDKLEDGVPEELEQNLTFPWPGMVGHCHISALHGVGMGGLAEAIETALVERTGFGAKQMQLLIPYTESAWYAKLKGPAPMAKVISDEATNEGYLLEIMAGEEAARRLGQFEVTSEASRAAEVDASSGLPAS